MRLRSFIDATPGRYLALSDGALRLAAQLWAKSRREGQPTSDSKALDVDVRLAAQVRSFQALASESVVATTNAKHLSRFVSAKHWSEIQPEIVFRSKPFGD